MCVNSVNCSNGTCKTQLRQSASASSGFCGNGALNSDVFQKSSMDKLEFCTMDCDYEINNMGTTVKILKNDDNSYTVYTLGSRADSTVEKKIISEDEFKKIYASQITQDDTSLNKTAKISESIIKTTPSMFNGFKTTYEGSLNSKAINLVETSKGITIFAEKDFEGTLDNKNIRINSKGSSYKGNYDGVEFNLELIRGGLFDFGKTAAITGTINNQKVELDLKQSDVPLDSKCADIIETILVLNGETARVENGKFKGTELSKWKIQQQNTEAAMMCAATMNQPPANTYVPTWHYDNPMAPVYY